VYWGGQETADKELSALAKGVLRLLNSAAPFDSEQVGGAVTAVLAATSDLNWHTRFAALTFLQSLVYRFVEFTFFLWRFQDLQSPFPNREHVKQ
jgi:hypothetical protein